MKKILAAVDFSEQSRLVLDRAAELARAFDGSVDVLHVVAPEPDFVGYTTFVYPGRDERASELRKEKAALAEMVHGLEASGISAKAFMKEAPTTEGVVAFALDHGADVIVLGAHGKNLLQRMVLGSSTHDILRHSPVPVLVVPPPSQGE